MGDGSGLRNEYFGGASSSLVQRAGTNPNESEEAVSDRDASDGGEAERDDVAVVVGRDDSEEIGVDRDVSVEARGELRELNRPSYGHASVCKKVRKKD